MHPFCLPFGFCHDATSSSITSDFSTSTALHNNNNNNNNNNNETTTKSNENSKIRSKTSSPSDELIRHLNNEDLIIGSSTTLGDESFYSLELGINIDENQDSEFVIHNNDLDLAGDLKDVDDDGEDDDDWFCNQYSLFSPNSIDITSTHPSRRKSLIKTLFSGGGGSSHHHQVFQHVVDPIDIKSSPTLAQLNLNSQDDPTDGLWDTTTHSNNHNQASSSSSSSSNNIDLLSNCTSIVNRNSVAPSGASNGIQSGSLANGGCIGNHHSSSTCNHLSHLHNNAHHTHHHHHQFVHLGANNHQSHTNSVCHHHHQLHPLPHGHHLHQQHLSPAHTTGCCGGGGEHVCAGAGSAHHQCLAVVPFRKPDNQHYPSSSACCHNSLLTTAMSSGSNLRPSATLNQLNQQLGQHNSLTSNGTATPTTTTATSKQQTEQNQKLCANQQQLARSASPALVTSSSSPGSLGAAAAQAAANENRLIDNKLKENIEYLTALLCNGTNKLDSNGTSNINNNQPQQQQQSSISSTMVRSYATLAHSLSTGPKLLERHSQLPTTMASNLQAQQPRSAAPATELQQKGALLTTTRLPTNEASPNAHISTNDQSLQLPPTNSLKRPHAGSDGQWFKYAVESSVSAADSTESQISGGLGHQPSQLCQTLVVGHPSADLMRQKTPELKVLSSLLNANKCHPQQQQPPSTNLVAQSWPPGQVIAPTPPMQAQPTVEQQATDVPVNGKPITLTPISTSNGILAQQLKPRTSLFAQPASPSASSTDSSGCASNHLTTTASSSDTSSVTSIGTNNKRQRASGPPIINSSNNNQKGRIGRPNSLSTDCSLSSHDEGFASQIDNDDAGSTRDSDDDDEIDSDDESFYGDYTNNDLIGASISDNAENKWTLNMGRTRRNGQKRYFWQYNVQSKGPKGARICSADDSENPFVLPEASDPVFSNDCQIEGVKHSGKARRGDGNDLTPNPRKLLMIGLELKKLGKIINDLAPVTDLPLNARNKTRKEKNKLASRACRLKKKAQHEANKIKLYGLQREHQQVVTAIYDVRKLLNETLLKKKKTKEESEASGSQVVMEQHNRLETNDNNGGCSNVDSSARLIAEQCSMQVAGQTSNYVNSVLEKVVSGCIDGGLQT